MPVVTKSDTIDWKTVRIAVVAARWNSFITDEMLKGAVDALKGKGIPDKQIYQLRCPGSFELPLACKYCLDELDTDGVVAIGAVIRGGTPHFDYVCDAVTRGITDLNLESGKPVAFGVLTTDTVEQAVERAGIHKGNKGAEAALSACEMIELQRAVKESGS
ncbi:6,7-dimethyl-8-ribityllumazine synthase [Rhodohalobacter mucosus]|uniref:6,7-dimethyl-8-ribityllumazine synthase n=1 Tax=Rhodohalobacter mucosus TaxID=2079485 RepID=A0A316TSF4_9BACT|nr:6,7-dimethyl-8-ribityllumazine synthase [Rhodohalobacter mucosus]PWN05152.1 6,7-dimethyl-8-ribityllumazine synthase [Rhodohalobacter mucosus]